VSVWGRAVCLLFLGEEYQSEEGCGFTDGEGGKEPELNENALQNLFAEAKISAPARARGYVISTWTAHTLQQAKKRTHGSNGFSAIGCTSPKKLRSERTKHNLTVRYRPFFAIWKQEHVIICS